MSKVKGHWRTVDGKRVWVEEHTRAGLSGGGGATPATVGLAGSVPTNPTKGTVSTVLQNKTAQLDQMLEQANAKIQERRQTLQKLDKHAAETLAWDTTEPAVLDALADHSHTDVQYAVSINPHVSGTTLDRLADKLTAPTRSQETKRMNASTLSDLVQNRNVEPKTLERLAKRNPPLHSNVLANIARNPSAPAALLESLRSHPSPQVREAVATHASIRGEVEQRLAQDESPDVRASLARNRNADPKIIRELLGDPDPLVAKCAKVNLEARNLL